MECFHVRSFCTPVLVSPTGFALPPRKTSDAEVDSGSVVRFRGTDRGEIMRGADLAFGRDYTDHGKDLIREPER